MAKIIKTLFHRYISCIYVIHAFVFRLCGVTIGNNVKLSSGCSFENPSGLSIGNETYVGSQVFFGAHNGISIGKQVMIGSGTSFLSADHNFDECNTPIVNQGMKHEDKEIVVEDNVWIGTKCIILKKVRLGKGSVIGAGSVVTKDVSPYTIVAGNPAKIIINRR